MNDSALNINELFNKRKHCSYILSAHPEQELGWVESESGLYFRASYFEVLESEYELNRLMVLQGYASLSDFIILLTHGDEDKDDILNDIGWSVASYNTYGYLWIDFYHTVEFDAVKEGEALYRIDYPFPPHDDYLYF